ncbi:hypothetical protein ATANTOWER_004187 [Ataeniobius toweri]|uniref:Uncharacterized protein n=1 Tax=Ataeniobius toweri TaxID=208326 RepID=A0ABU7ASQ8_9TELE|nr:hypothetical protein [Ataeniobius toweri]
MDCFFCIALGKDISVPEGKGCPRNLVLVKDDRKRPQMFCSKHQNILASQSQDAATTMSHCRHNVFRVMFSLRFPAQMAFCMYAKCFGLVSSDQSVFLHIFALFPSWLRANCKLDSWLSFNHGFLYATLPLRTDLWSTCPIVVLSADS